MLRPIVPRARALKDIDRAISFYLREAGGEVALGFIDALEAAYRHIASYPGSGSLRYAHEMNLPSLRNWPIKRFPYIVFFVEREDHIDVWRILHAERDIPRWLQDPPSLAPSAKGKKGGCDDE